MAKIKEMRQRAGLSQDQVAEALGITKRRYGSWERGERCVSLNEAVKIADICNCTLDELAGREAPDHTAFLLRTIEVIAADLSDRAGMLRFAAKAARQPISKEQRELLDKQLKPKERKDAYDTI